jgi:catechol-2,3-dioxygenase
VFQTASGQSLALAKVTQARDLSETGVHHALRVNDTMRDRIAEHLAAEGVALHTYSEDREAEKNDNFFFFDPDGNRLQLVTIPGESDGIQAIDHTAILAFDMLWAEKFYVDMLGLDVEGRVGWKTADHARARIWAAGNEDMAPGTRRLDKLYMTMGGQNEVPRANMQIYLQTGDSLLMLYLATQHFQEPPEGQAYGTPRTIFAVGRDILDQTASILDAAGQIFEGPVKHAKASPFEASLYMRDPSGNFIELCSVRK